MRRSSYHDRAERNHPNKAASKSQVQDLHFNNFKLSSSKMPENNFVSTRPSMPYYQPKTAKHLFTRPFTTQKTSSYLDYKSTSSPTQNKPKPTWPPTSTKPPKISPLAILKKNTISNTTALRTKPIAMNSQGENCTEAALGNMIKKHSKRCSLPLRDTTVIGGIFRIISNLTPHTERKDQDYWISSDRI